jgi:DNA-binding beta-propeller fold protein YncE
MRHISWSCVWVYLFLTLATASVNLTAAPPAPSGRTGYHLIKKIHIGGDGFWDYLTMDSEARRLYISHGTHVLVFNPDTYKQVGDLPDTEGVHGVALAPELGRGFTSNGRAGTVTIFELKTLKEIGHVKTTGQNPDCILYDPASRRVFTFNGRSENATAIDATSGTVLGTIELGGKPEFATADGKGRIYVNLEDKSEGAELDRRALKVEARWPLAPCENPSGMAIDREHRRLFIGCHNQMMAVMNADTGQVITTLPICQGVDANRFDPETRLAFSSNGDGTLTIVHEDSPDKFTEVDSVPTQRGARTMALDRKTHRVFLVTAEFGPPPAPTAERPHPWPTVVPDSFTLLVFGK